MSNLLEVEVNVWKKLVCQIKLGNTTKNIKFQFKLSTFESLLVKYKIENSSKFNMSQPKGMSNRKWG